MYEPERESVSDEDEADNFSGFEIGFRNNRKGSSTSCHDEKTGLYNQENVEDCIDL